MDMKINKETLRRERELRAWTQSHLAEVADLSMRTVQRIERTGDASLESAGALAAALDLELAVLMDVPGRTDQALPAKPHRYKLWGAVGLLSSAIIALGWWSNASAKQVMIGLSVKAEMGSSTRGELHILNELGVPSEIKFDQQFRLLVTVLRQDQGLLLSTEIYDYIDGDYQLVSTPAILIADNESAAIQLNTRASGRLEFDFKPDF
ncbi:MAG TPA: helix-turn-helix transcriptional regulator [Cellvibrio sp.]|nr:helix-turn-helix transcriptional regulator [Cellvibrio sp.]